MNKRLYNIAVTLFCLSFMLTVVAVAEESDDKEVVDNNSGSAGDNILQSFGHQFYEKARKARRNLTLGVEIEQKYDDNIYRESEDPDWDYITVISPGISWDFIPDLPDSRTQIGTSFLVEFYQKYYYYARNTQLNSKLNRFWFFPSISLNTTYDRANFFFQADRDQKFAAQVYSMEEKTEQARDRSVIFTMVRYGASYTPGAGRIRLPLRYEHEETFFEDEEDKHNSFRRDRVTAGADIALQEGVSFFVNGSFTVVKRPKMVNGDSQYKNVSVGLRGDFSSKINGVLSLGKVMADNKMGEDTSAVIGEATFEYKILERFVMELSLRRSLHDTSDDFDQKNNGFDKESSLVGGGSVVGVAENLTDIEANYSYNDSAKIGFGYSPSIIKKLKITNDYIYSNVEFDDGVKEYRYDVFLSANYTIRENFNIIARYSYRNKISDVESRGYVNNVFSLGLYLDF